MESSTLVDYVPITIDLYSVNIISFDRERKTARTHAAFWRALPVISIEDMVTPRSRSCSTGLSKVVSETLYWNCSQTNGSSRR